MFHLNNILAAADTGAAKVIFAAIFLLVWFAISATSALAKKKQQEISRKPPNKIAPRRSTAAPPPARINRNAKMPPRVFQSSPITAAPVIAQTKTVMVPPPASRSMAGNNGISPLLRPRNLRQQIIIAEILQPPLALRERESEKNIS